MVLQGFTLAANDEVIDMYEMSRDGMRDPRLDELVEMVDVSIDGGVDAVVWWGQSLLREEHRHVWDNVLRASRHASGVSA